MLYIHLPFVAFIELLGVENIILNNLIFKIPLLISDLAIYFGLINLFPSKKNKVLFFYFLNPIILYSIYVHSQLDIVPMSLFFIGIILLCRDKIKLSALFIGLSLATKFHVLVSIPMLVFFLIKKERIKDALIFFAIIFSVIFLLDLPFLFSDGFNLMVLNNSKQSLLFDSFFSIGELKLFFPILSIFLVYIHFINQNRINQDLLFFYFGVLFTVTIFFIYPNPGWYVWIVPFVSIYFINSANQINSKILYSIFSLAFLLFFILFYQSEYNDIIFISTIINLKIQNILLVNISYTLLLSMLILVLYAFYNYGIKSNSFYKKKSNLVIGIGGDSSVGKTTLLNNLFELLGSQLISIEGDGDHKWERNDNNWKTFTHLDPKANYIHRQSEAIYELKNNRPILRSEYNHSNGKFTESIRVNPKRFIAIAGLHPFYLPKQRKNIDLKIFVNTDEKLRKHWKVLRDVKKRGYDPNDVIKQIKIRHKDSKKFIIPQMNFADMIIEFKSVDDFKIGDTNKDIKLSLKVILDINIDLEVLFKNSEFDFIWDYNDDLKTQFIKLDQEPKIDFESLANKSITNIYDIVNVKSNWLKGYEGLIQYLCLLMISENLKKE